MDEKSNSVFISYRREPAWTLVEALYQRVTAAGIDVFYDTHSIRAGKFDEVILSQIRARPYFLLVLVPGTLERCGDAGDWLRREIETAIESDRLIIPVYTPNFELKSLRGDLPGRLGETLLRYNAQELPHKLFKYAVQELVEEFLIPTTIAVTAAPIEDQEEVDKLHRGASETSPVTEEQLLAQGFFEAGNLKINSRVIQPAGWGPIELADAIADYTESIRLNPNYAPTHYRRGLAYWLGRNGTADGVEDYARLAMADFDDAIRLDPGDPQAFNLRGSAHAANESLVPSTWQGRWQTSTRRSASIPMTLGAGTTEGA